MSLYQKKILLTSLFLLLVAIIFWTGSRYPQLNEKALMGNEAPTMGISFDMPFQTSEVDPWWIRIGKNTINWVDTNKKGMTFGILFGAILMVLFALLKSIQTTNRWLNTLIGAVIGAPLGVCVNCAAPIAKGMKDAGAKSETALATMISSPTLNVIVLSILFALLPPYMVWLKIGFTLLIILLFVPLLSRFFSVNDISSIPEGKSKLPAFIHEENKSEIDLNNSWWAAFKWMTINFFKSLWFLIKTTVPLMLLAGFLGNVLVTFVPLEGLVHYIPKLSSLYLILFMFFIALVGTFLPVPIAFDVIITAILWSAGLPARYAFILLFTLGSYSIYSAFIVNKAFSRKMAFSIFLLITVTGFVGGFIAHKLEKKYSIDYRIESYEWLKSYGKSPNSYQVASLNHELLSSTEIEEIKKQSMPFKEMKSNEEIRIFQQAFKSKEGNTQNWFQAFEGPNLGVDLPYHFSVWNFFEPLANQRSIASGDIHQDGFPDLLFSSAGQLFLYANLKGERFIRQPLSITKDLNVFNASLVDIDNDGWLDIFFSTYKNGNYLLFNKNGHFEESRLLLLPQTKDLVLTQSVAFGNLNNDKLLDIVLGNWTIGTLGERDYSMPESQNFMLINKGNREFELVKLKEKSGETLSSLITDFTGDAASDLWIGNDFLIDDQFYENQIGTDTLKWIKNIEDVVERITETTMSITTADLNNDLEKELYMVQVDRTNRKIRTTEIDEICASIKDDKQKRHCEAIYRLQKALTTAVNTKNYEVCPEEFYSDCIAADIVLSRNYIAYIEDPCQYLPDSWSEYDFICNYNFDEERRQQSMQGKSTIAKQFGGIALAKENGKWKDKTEKYKLEATGWAWNSKFADLDNDGWQDLYIANGYLIKNIQETNIFYQNKKGENFENKTAESGLENHLPASSYSYVDYDLDGDLDIILATSIGPVFIYQNNNHKNNSIAIQLKDEIGNYFGIGAKIYIFYGNGENQMREVLASGGYKSFDSPVVYFGLKGHKEVEKVKIVWPDQTQTVINQPLQSGAIYNIARSAKN